MEIKKSQQAQLDDKRTTFFLLGLVLAFSVIFVAFQYQSGPESMEESETDLEELVQDLSLNLPPEQKDMVSAEAYTAPASKALTQEVKAADEPKPEKMEQKIATTTSELMIGDGEGAVNGSDIKEVAPETPIDNTNPTALHQAPVDFTVVQKIPEFPGGWSAFMQWLTKNLKYPPQAQQQKKQGTVVVSFIVGKDGTVSDVKLSASSSNPLLDREALRVMRMMPKWKPGIDHDKPCRTMIAVPVVFKL